MPVASLEMECSNRDQAEKQQLGSVCCNTASTSPSNRCQGHSTACDSAQGNFAAVAQCHVTQQLLPRHKQQLPPMSTMHGTVPVAQQPICCCAVVCYSTTLGCCDVLCCGVLCYAVTCRSGMFQWKNSFLAHERLAIIDPASGDQPLFNEDRCGTGAQATSPVA